MIMQTSRCFLAISVLVVAAVGCGDDDATGTDAGPRADAGGGGVDGGGGDVDGGGGDVDAGGGGGDLLPVPATATTMAGIGGTIESAYLCQNFGFGGTINWSLQDGSASPCLGGATYMRFDHDPSGPTYLVAAGDYIPSADAMDPSMWTPVTFSVASSGTIGAGADGDELTGYSPDEEVTLSTGEFVIKFMVSGSTVTITAFDAV